MLINGLQVFTVSMKGLDGGTYSHNVLFENWEHAKLCCDAVGWTLDGKTEMFGKFCGDSDSITQFSEDGKTLADFNREAEGE